MSPRELHTYHDWPAWVWQRIASYILSIRSYFTILSTKKRNFSHFIFILSSLTIIVSYQRRWNVCLLRIHTLYFSMKSSYVFGTLLSDFLTPLLWLSFYLEILFYRVTVISPFEYKKAAGIISCFFHTCYSIRLHNYKKYSAYLPMPASCFQPPLREHRQSIALFLLHQA